VGGDEKEERTDGEKDRRERTRSRAMKEKKKKHGMRIWE
jgi:hypothetical protein